VNCSLGFSLFGAFLADVLNADFPWNFAFWMILSFIFAFLGLLTDLCGDGICGHKICTGYVSMGYVGTE